LYERGKVNGVQGLRLLTDERDIRAIEPHCRGIAAIHSPRTGIVDYGRVAASLADDVRAAGGDVRPGHAVTRLDRESHTAVLSGPAFPVRQAT
jgi:(S)-2-hydroxyglutarate dehydrogenase